MPIFRNTRWRVLPALVITTLVVGSLSTTAIAFAAYQSSPSTYNGRCHQQGNCHRPTTTVATTAPTSTTTSSTTSTTSPPPRQAPQGPPPRPARRRAPQWPPRPRRSPQARGGCPGKALSNGSGNWTTRSVSACATDMGYNDKTYTGATAPISRI